MGKRLQKFEVVVSHANSKLIRTITFLPAHIVDEQNDADADGTAARTVANFAYNIVEYVVEIPCVKLK